MAHIFTLPETNISPAKKPSQKETHLPTLVFQVFSLPEGMYTWIFLLRVKVVPCHTKATTTKREFSSITYLEDPGILIYIYIFIYIHIYGMAVYYKPFRGIIFHKPIRIRFPVIHWNVRKSMAVRLPALNLRTPLPETRP